MFLASRFPTWEGQAPISVISCTMPCLYGAAKYVVTAAFLGVVPAARFQDAGQLGHPVQLSPVFKGHGRRSDGTGLSSGSQHSTHPFVPEPLPDGRPEGA